MTVLTKILMFANTASVKGKLILIDVNFNCDETHKIVKKGRILELFDESSPMIFQIRKNSIDFSRWRRARVRCTG